jgi:hypothetical protein
MEGVAYNELENRKKPTTTIDDNDETYDCYELHTFNMLNTLITVKLPSAIYVHVESLWEPELSTTVYNLMFFDDAEQHLGGCELTNQRIFWDEEDVVEV